MVEVYTNSEVFIIFGQWKLPIALDTSPILEYRKMSQCYYYGPGLF